MRSLFVCVAFFLVACPRPVPLPPQPPPMGSPGDMSACPAKTMPVAEDACERRFLVTPGPDGTHSPCAMCPPAASGCFIASIGVYCVVGRNCADPACALDPGSL